jgi:hypothetical protein
MNRIKTLRQWANLSTEDKNSFPKGLKTIFEKACESEEPIGKREIIDRE